MELREAFGTFVTSDEVDTITIAFNKIIKILSLGSKDEITIESIASEAEKEEHNLPYSYRKILTLLKDRRARCSVSPYSTERRIVISGAGPCGLRAAVEARMLGWHVSVIEKRGKFSRHNIVKTWKETIADLLSFGLQFFIPNFKPHGHCHLGIRQTQIVLFKAALLFGVRFHYRTRTVGVFASPATSTSAHPAWMVCAVHTDEILEERAPVDHLSLKPTRTDFETAAIERTSRVDFYERAESENGAILAGPPASSNAIHLPFDSLLLAEGESSWMIRNLGFDRKLVRYSQAIGIVVNLKLGPSSSSSLQKVESFVVSRSDAEWRAGPLGRLCEADGIEVENMEYMTGTDTHFIVVTAKKSSLLEFGVLRADIDTTAGMTVAELLSHENVDEEQLRAFGRCLADAAGLGRDVEFSDFHPVQIFDFSAKGRCTTFAKQLPDSGTGCNGLIFPIGDAAQNPFWPQGLGVNRGFHSALDAVWAAQQSFALEALAERQCAWAVMDFKVFSQSSINPASKWSSDPTTRYSRGIYQAIHMQEISLHAEKSALTQRVKEALKIK